MRTLRDITIGLTYGLGIVLTGGLGVVVLYEAVARGHLGLALLALGEFVLCAFQSLYVGSALYYRADRVRE